METVRREWPAPWIAAIAYVSRVESGGRPDVVLAADDERRVYLIEAAGVDEKLVICEDGELLRKMDSPDWHAYTF